MWGSYEEKFAQARLLYVYMYTHPGKKLTFMGNEIAQIIEWNYKREIDWFLLEYPIHDAFNKFIKDAISSELPAILLSNIKFCSNISGISFNEYLS